MHIMRLTVPYKSAWFSVVLPTLIFLGVWFGLFLSILALLPWNTSDWLGMLICGGGIIPGLLVSVATYPLLVHLSDRGRGELILEGDRLRWRTGRRWQEMDFSQPHHTQIAAGHSGLNKANASITLSPGGQMIHLRGMRRQEVLGLFPEPYFIDELAALPEEGLWGFEFHAADPNAVRFFTGLLECLWRNRAHNQRYQLFQKFPWNDPPRPAFRHIRLIEWEKRTPEEEALIQDLAGQFVDDLTSSYGRATPDYLVGWGYHSLKSNLSGWPDYYCRMPLGYIRAEVSLPRPDWKPFIIGHVLKEALATALGTTAPSGAPYLEHRRYLYIRGKGKDGTPLELAFDWFNPGDEGYEAAEMWVRFVQREVR